jgi:hypothetical protein
MLLLWVLGVWNRPRDYANPDLIWIITVLKLQTFESWWIWLQILLFSGTRRRRRRRRRREEAKWWDPGLDFLQVCRPTTTSLLDFHFLC